MIRSVDLLLEPPILYCEAVSKLFFVAKLQHKGEFETASVSRRRLPYRLTHIFEMDFKNKIVSLGLCLLILGVGIYFAQSAFFNVRSDGQNFSRELADVLHTALGAKKSTAETSAAGDAKKASGAWAKNCVFEASEVLRRGPVILNEIAWMGGARNPKNEWIELKNISSRPADISGWRLFNQNGKINLIVKNGAKIPAGDFYLLERGSNDFLPGATADQFFTGAVKNSDEGIRLFDAQCALVDEVSANIASEKNWPAGDSAAQKTMERDPETLAWHTSALPGGTPKKENSASLKLPEEQNIRATTTPHSSPPATGTTANQPVINQPSAANAHPILCAQNSSRTLSRAVLINEVAWAGVASDKTSQEWIELKNNSGAKISLEGWRLQNADQGIKMIFAASDLIPAGGFYLLERGGTDFIAGVKADKFFTGAVKNSDESLRLFDKSCNVIDEIVADIGAGKNWPAGAADPEYRTAERSSDLSWRTYRGSGTNRFFGTPRAENSSPQPAASQASQNATSPPPPAPTHYSLQVLKSGMASGSLTSDPSGIDCAASCLEDSKDFLSGVSVTLSATPSDGAQFTGWSGACSGSVTCTIQMDGSKSVRAIFDHIASIASTAPSSSATSQDTATSSPPRSNVNHILISQVQTTGGAGHTENDFVEMYNQAADQFNLKGYRLVKRTQTGTSDTLIKSWTADAFIPGYGFYLWANSGFASIAVLPDNTTTASIADNNGVALRFGPNNTGTIIDSVAWGGASTTNAFVEGSVFATNPAANQSMLRKSWQGACVAASSDASGGNGCDTDSNASDFEMMDHSHPRNSLVR